VTAGKSPPVTWDLASYRCGADPVVRACVIPSLSKNCIAISAQARIGSSSAHFTSTASSPCSMRKWAALEGGGGPSPLGETSPRGPPPGGCGACPVVVGPPGCGEDDAPGAAGRGPPDGDCGGCAKAAVASNAAVTAKHMVESLDTVLSCQRWFCGSAQAPTDLRMWCVVHLRYQPRHAAPVPA
jgi:hypothetical protein